MVLHDPIQPGRSPLRERRRRNREQMIAAILDAARAVMRERGVADLSLREVARRVSMQAPSLYEYFLSKAALYDALFLAGLGCSASGCSAPRRRPAPSGSRRRPASRRTWGSPASTDLYQLLFEHPCPGFAPSEGTMAEGRAPGALHEPDRRGDRARRDRARASHPLRPATC